MPPDGRLAIVLADGTIADRATMDAAWPGWDDGASLVVAADGGARHAVPLGLTLDRWVGDGDSIDADDLAALEASGVRIDRLPAAKDASDAELALEAVIADGADDVVLLGALGGRRLDHALSNLGLLHHPGLHGRRVVLFDAQAARISLLTVDAAPVTVQLDGRRDDLVSLLPVGETAEGVTTDGLQYPLRDEPLVLGRTRGVSNVRTAPRATVSLRRGRILVIETPATVRP